MTAVNRQRMFVVVREPERSYADTQVQPYGGRALPWRTVRITTVATPNLAAMYGDHPESATVVTNPQGIAYGKDAFWPMVPPSWTTSRVPLTSARPQLRPKVPRSSGWRDWGDSMRASVSGRSKRSPLGLVPSFSHRRA